jgi:transposase
MTPRRTKNLRMPPVTVEPLRVHNPHAAGIDIHAAEHWVAVSPDQAIAAPVNHPCKLPAHVRRFGTCTADLEMLADWLKACGVTTVAMESTGVYWVALFELLERRGFQVFLVDPRQTKQVSGRPKTDIHDCQWIQRLHSYGLLAASFRPEDQVVVLRSYLRHRHTLVRSTSQHVLRMQKALELMNVKLTQVVSNITGLTGLAIIEAILAGQRNPLLLAKLRNERCRRTEAEIARALYGNWRVEHLFALQQAFDIYKFYQDKLRECDQVIERHLGSFTDRSGGRKLEAPPRKRRPRQAAFDVRSALHRFSGVDLTMIEGIDQTTALTILSEIGHDMSKWPSPKHFVSWLGLCPQHETSAGKIKKRRRRKGANPASRAFRMAAQGCYHAHNALGAFYRRIQARCGGPKAIMATAHKIAERVYRLLKYGEAYVRQGIEAADEAYKAKRLRGLARAAKELGYNLVAGQVTEPVLG